VRQAKLNVSYRLKSGQGKD